MRNCCRCLLSVAALVALPATASAAGYTLDAGYDHLPGAPEPTAPLKFYAPSITIPQGSSVTWNIKGFHTVTFLKRKQKLPGFGTADPHLISGLNDAAGNPFWFNGLPYGGVTRESSTVTKVKSYTGDQYVNTGFPGTTKSLTLKFPKKGRFTYYCIIHPGQVGVVKVVGPKQHAQTPAQVRAKVTRLEAADARRAHQTDSLSPPANTVYVGYQLSDGVSVNKMFPETLTVSVGTRVSFSAKKQVFDESHTVTFGPEGPQAQQTGGAIPLPGGPEGYFVMSPYAGPYTSEADMSNVAYDGSNHGDGFLNLGLLSKTAPVVKVTFTKAGSYRYVCIFHPKMDGTINVT